MTRHLQMEADDTSSQDGRPHCPPPEIEAGYAGLCYAIPTIKSVKIGLAGDPIPPHRRDPKQGLARAGVQVDHADALRSGPTVVISRSRHFLFCLHSRCPMGVQHSAAFRPIGSNNLADVFRRAQHLFTIIPVQQTLNKHLLLTPPPPRVSKPRRDLLQDRVHSEKAA